MNWVHSAAGGALASLAIAGWALPASDAAAAEVIPAAGNSLTVEMNEGSLVRIDQPASAVFVANPDIADVAVKSPRLIYIFGKRPGETTVYAVDENEDVLLNLKLTVNHNLSRLRSAVDNLLPGTSVNLQSVEGAIVMNGDVATAAEAEDARRLAARFIGENEEVINRLKVTAPNQVNLRVRIAEVSRTLLRQLGVDWTLTGSTNDITFGFASQNFLAAATALGARSTVADTLALSGSKFGIDFNALIDALAQENLVSLLAEPNLTALSGETASFLAGGEFPVPVVQDASDDSSTITVEFKNFGVSLAFTPTLIGSSRISMRVRPEVSALSDDAANGAVDVSGFTIPALVTRRAETTVELASGQSFAIAGLIQNNSAVASNKVPGLGDIPILGELFKSDAFQRNETELVIVVTPYIVQPVSSLERVALPTDATFGPEGTGRMVTNRTRVLPAPPTASTPGAAPAPGGTAAPAGFVLE